jgi:hypothetical protein
MAGVGGWGVGAEGWGAGIEGRETCSAWAEAGRAGSGASWGRGALWRRRAEQSIKGQHPLRGQEEEVEQRAQPGGSLIEGRRRPGSGSAKGSGGAKGVGTD